MTRLQTHLAECMVGIEAGGRRGAGFWVAPGCIMTSAGMVEDPANGDYPFPEAGVVWKDRRFTARVIGYAASPNPDLAVLAVEPFDHPCVYLFEPLRTDDPLRVYGPAAEAAEGLAVTARETGDALRLKGAAGDARGNPVLNLRTGGIVAVVGGALDDAWRATPVAVALRLFPGVKEKHDAYHASQAGWFEGVATGTVCWARQHLSRVRALCEDRAGRLPAPPAASAAWRAPLRFRVFGANGDGGNLLDVDGLAGAAGDRPGILIVGPTGSGRSGTLRRLGLGAASAFGNLGAGEGVRPFPILVRASQLRPAEEGAIESGILDAIARTHGLGEDRPPPGFLSDLAASRRVRLWLMIDGIDEIQNSRDLADMVDFIARIPKDGGFGRQTTLLVTSRPSAIEHFRYSDFVYAEVQPLDAAARRAAAEAWLGASARESIHAVSHDVALASPLALTVALKLYARGRKPSSTRLVDLYADFIEEVRREWRLRGRPAQYGDRIVEAAPEVLGHLALATLRAAVTLEDEWVAGVVERRLEELHGLTAAEAAAQSRRFLEFAVTDGFFLGRDGGRFYWEHLSFRDYLAARELVAGADPAESGGAASREIRGRWFDPNWGRTPAFALQLLPSAAEQARILDEVLGSGRESRLDFAAALIQEGARVDEPLLERLVDELARKAAEERDAYGGILRPSPRASFGFDLMLALSHLAPVQAAVEQLLRDPSLPARMRLRVEQYGLGESG